MFFSLEDCKHKKKITYAILPEKASALSRCTAGLLPLQD